MCRTPTVSRADTGSLESAFICCTQWQHCASQSLSYYSEEIVMLEECIRVFWLWRIITCATGEVLSCVSRFFLPASFFFFVATPQKKVHNLNLNWVKLSFNFMMKIWRHAYVHTVWQECHLLASPVTASGGCGQCIPATYFKSFYNIFQDFF